MKNFLKNTFALTISFFIFFNAHSKNIVQYVTVAEMKNMLPPTEIIALNDRIYNKSIADDGFNRLEKNSIEVENFSNQIKEVKKQAYIALFEKNKKNKLVYEKLSDLKLTFKPFQFNKGRLIAVIPGGTTINGAWTSV